MKANLRIVFIFSVIFTAVFLSNAQLFIPVTFWRAQPEILVISEAASYNYGTVATNTNVDKTFVVTNTSSSQSATTMSGVAFSSANFTWAGGTYPGGGTCGTTLAAGASCTVVVRANSATATTTTSAINISHFNGASMATATRPITAVFATVPVKLVFISTPSYIVVNTCTAVTVQTQDDNGNPINVGANTTINLTVNNAAATQYFTTNTCGTATSTRTITTGTNSVTFYIRSTTANQSGIMVATATGLNTAELPFVVSAVAARLYIVVSPQIKVNVCREVIVYATDNNYIPANVATTTAIGGGTTGTHGIFTNATCTNPATSASIAAGTSSITLYVSSNSVQSVTLTATATGLTSGTANTSFVNTLTWWNASWARRLRITINNADQATAHTNIPVLVRLNTSRVTYSQMLASGADIRFVASDNTTVLPHQIDTWAPGGESLIWVRVGNLAASTHNNIIYMYYGNTAATDTQNGATTFSSYWSNWHLGEDPTGTAPQYLDSVGGRSGTATNSPTKQRGFIGYSAGLLSATDAVAINADLSPVLGATSTFSCWIKTTQTGDNTMWMAPGITGVEEAGGGNDIFWGWIDGTGYIGVTAGNGADAKSGFVVNDNAWRHVTITRDSASGAVQFFVNGVLSATATSEGGNKTTYFNLLGEIGDTGGSPVNLNGILDEVRIYNSVQTSARILADFKYMLETYIIYSVMEVQ